MPFVVITAPAILPVTVAEVKAHTIIEDSADDSLIEQYIRMFTAYGQNRTGRQFVATEMELSLRAFPAGRIDLKPDLQLLSSIKYTDSDGYPDIVDIDNYSVFDWSVFPVGLWPTGATDVKIRFEAGWPVSGESISTTPEDIKGWIMVRCAGIYEHRENFILSAAGKFGVAEMPKDFIDSALDLYAIPVVP